MLNHIPSMAAAAAAVSVDGTVVTLAYQGDAKALVRVVLAASKTEFDNVEFWKGTDETRVELNMGDSVEFVKEGLLRVAALRDKLSLLLSVCQEGIAAKLARENQVRSVMNSLNALGVVSGVIGLDGAVASFAAERLMLENAAEVHTVLLAEASTAHDELTNRLFDLYPGATTRLQ